MLLEVMNNYLLGYKKSIRKLIVNEVTEFRTFKDVTPSSVMPLPLLSFSETSKGFALFYTKAY